MSLKPSTGADLATQIVQNQIDRLENSEILLGPAAIAVALASAYHTYAKEATLSGADCTFGGNVSILESAFITDNSTAVPENIAQGICDYWSTITAPGTPSHGGTTVISVTVDGSAILSAMKAAVQNVTVGGWSAFFSATGAIVKTIPCTVTEMMPGTPPYPQAFMETIA